MMLREISEMSEAEGRVAAAKLIEKIPAIARPMVKAILESL